MGLIGYARISTSEGRQVLDRQLDALGAVECERIFQDTASGADAARPGLVACLDHLRRNDVLVVLDLDRLGRTLNTKTITEHYLVTVVPGGHGIVAGTIILFRTSKKLAVSKPAPQEA